MDRSLGLSRWQPEAEEWLSEGSRPAVRVSHAIEPRADVSRGPTIRDPYWLLALPSLLLLRMLRPGGSGSGPDAAEQADKVKDAVRGEAREDGLDRALS
jgi:hypothetical protein